MKSSDVKLGALLLLLFALFAYGLAPYAQRLRASSARERAAKSALFADDGARVRLLFEREL